MKSIGFSNNEPVTAIVSRAIGEDRYANKRRGKTSEGTKRPRKLDKNLMS